MYIDKSAHNIAFSAKLYYNIYGDYMELFEHYIKSGNTLFKHAKGKSVMSGKEFHIYNEIIYFLDGKAELITEFSRTKIKPHTLIAIPKETYHQVRILGNAENYHRCIINFDCLKLNNFFTCTADSEIDYLFSKLMNCTSSPDSGEILKAVLILLTDKISSQTHSNNATTSQNSLVSKCINYINENLSEELSVCKIAKFLNMSESSVAHIFKKEMNISLHKYVTEKRLMAAYRRISSGESATSVYLECGFKDYSNFYRQYKKLLGFAPSHK